MKGGRDEEEAQSSDKLKVQGKNSMKEHRFTFMTRNVSFSVMIARTAALVERFAFATIVKNCYRSKRS